MAAFATPELQGLFTEWLELDEQQVVDAVGESGPRELEVLASKLDLTVESTALLLARLGGSGKLRLTVRASGEKGKTQPDGGVKKTGKKRR